VEPTSGRVTTRGFVSGETSGASPNLVLRHAVDAGRPLIPLTVSHSSSRGRRPPEGQHVGEPLLAQAPPIVSRFGVSPERASLFAYFTRWNSGLAKGWSSSCTFSFAPRTRFLGRWASRGRCGAKLPAALAAEPCVQLPARSAGSWTHGVCLSRQSSLSRQKN